MSVRHRLGLGPLVVLSHPHTGDQRVFDPLLECWSGNALTWDRRGYGQSTNGWDETATQESDLATVLETFQEPAVLLGVAAGGAVSVAFTARWPARVCGLILVGSFMGRPSGYWTRRTGERPPTGSAAERELSSSFRSSPRSSAWLAMASENEARGCGEPPQPCASELSGIADRADVTIATGGEDLLFTPAMLAQATQLLPRARSFVLPGVAHAAPFEDPLAFANWLEVVLNH